MPSWVIDILLAEAAVFILVMTGCFVTGMVSEAIRQRYERWAHELADMPHDRLEAMAFGRSACSYPFGMVADELEKRLRSSQRMAETAFDEQRMDATMRTLMALGEQRERLRSQMDEMTHQVDQGFIDMSLMMQASDEEPAEPTAFYADNYVYTVISPSIPPTYGTTERV